MTKGTFDVRGKPALLITLLLAVLLVAAGCRRDRGGDDSDGVTAGASVAATATAGAAGDAATPKVRRPQPGASRGSMEIGGTEREWRLYVPESLEPSGDVSLVLGLHGGLGSGEQFAADAYFDEQAERGGFIAVYPDGISRRVVAARTWNGGGCCGYAMDQGVDDVGFLVALIEELSAGLPIDPDRVYMTGHSNGAIMSYRMACERADLIAAIAVYAGALEVECAPSEPVSVLAIHGDGDKNIPIEGGVGPSALTDTDYHSLGYAVSVWSAVNGCHPEPVIVDAGALLTSIWEGCGEGGALRTIVVHGASHSWPGGAPTGPLRPDPSRDLDASSAVWNFLETKRR